MNANIKTEVVKNKNLAIAVLNYVSCGKTTISNYLLSPRLNDAFVQPIETVNADGDQKEVALGAKKFKEAMAVVDNRMANHLSVIVDIGASNVEECLREMKKHSAFEDFDYFIFPTTPDKRTILNTCNAILDLVDKFGVDGSKIRVVFNRVEVDTDISVSVMFSQIYALGKLKNIPIAGLAVIHDVPVYELLNKRTMQEIVGSTLDFAELQRLAKTSAEMQEIAKERGLVKMARSEIKALDKVFDALAFAR